MGVYERIASFVLFSGGTGGDGMLRYCNWILLREYASGGLALETWGIDEGVTISRRGAEAQRMCFILNLVT
jgi:hypothetical protein